MESYVLGLPEGSWLSSDGLAHSEPGASAHSELVAERHWLWLLGPLPCKDSNSPSGCSGAGESVGDNTPSYSVSMIWSPGPGDGSLE